MIVRAGKEHLRDLQDLIDLVTKYWIDVKAEDRLRDEDARLYVCLDSTGEVVGYLDLKPWPDVSVKGLEVLGVSVRKDEQGLGFGRELLEFAELEGKRAGFDWLYLRTYVNNLRAFFLYKRIGYGSQRRVLMNKRWAYVLRKKL